MRNRAQCKLCNCIIESLNMGDLVTCECKEIAVDGGEEQYIVYYKNVGNFLRIDDEDNILTVTEMPEQGHTRKELLVMLDDMIKSTEQLPQQALVNSPTHYDLLSFMILVSSLFKAED